MAASSRLNLTRTGIALLIGIIILAVLVIGGLVFLRDRGEQTRREQAISVADQQLKEDSDRDIAIDSGNGNSQAKTEAAPSGEPAPSTAPAAADPAPSSTPEASTLPETGPELAPIIAVALLSFAAASYLQSRRRLFGL
jgi:predicted lipid-binding transport protein (Tim44 family)